MTEIIPGFYIGTAREAAELGRRVPPDWVCISVTEYRAHYGRSEECPNEPIGSHDLPFMHVVGANRRAFLERIVSVIDEGRRRKSKVLVHCVQAVERSPLIAAWYLFRSGRARDLDTAYAQVIAKHPHTQRRDRWILDVF